MRPKGGPGAPPPIWLASTPVKPGLKIYTKTGDDGTTGLLFGGRVAKDSIVMQVNGTVDEAQAVMGMARAETEAGSELDVLLTGLERDLYVLMAEVATDPANRSKLKAGLDHGHRGRWWRRSKRTSTTSSTRIDMPTEFVVPGANRTVGRTRPGPDRRAPSRAAGGRPPRCPARWSAPYLNRLSDLLWALARFAEGDEHLLARGAPRRGRRGHEAPAMRVVTQAGGALPDRRGGRRGAGARRRRRADAWPPDGRSRRSSPGVPPSSTRPGASGTASRARSARR